MRKEISIREWIVRFNDGKYASSDVETQIEAGWYDWFCKDSSLANKTKRMGNIIKQIKPGGKVDLEKSYIWFKNNCPLDGALYDDFRIADIETDATQIIFQIHKNENFTKYICKLFERSNDFKDLSFEFNAVVRFVKWINEKR